MSHTLAIVSQKGGVGKTTLAANLAVAFGSLHFRTLLVEVDPQGSLVHVFGIDRFDVHAGLLPVLMEGLDPESARIRDLAPGMDLLSANVWSHEEESLLLEALESDPLALRAAVAPLTDQYDYVIIDGPPSLGPLSRACLAAADSYLVPVQAEALNLETLPRLRRLADEIRTRFNPGLLLEGLAITMADARTRHANEVILRLAETYPRHLLQTIIPRSVRVAEEGARGRPTVLGRPSTPVGRALVRLAEEILSRHSRERAAREAADADSPTIDVWETLLEGMEEPEPIPRAEPQPGPETGTALEEWD